MALVDRLALRARRAPTRSSRSACRSRRPSSAARDRSSEASPSPYRPGRNVAFGLLLTALVTKIRSPHTTGLECARPGIGVRHRMFSPLAPSQRSGRFCPSATPEACAPAERRPAAGAAAAGGNGHARRGGRPDDVSDRDAHDFARRTPSAAIENHPPRRAGVGDEVEGDVRLVLFDRDTVAARLVAAAGRIAGVRSSIVATVALPRSLERRPSRPSSAKVPSPPNRAEKAPNFSGSDGIGPPCCPATGRVHDEQRHREEGLEADMSHG